MTELAPDNYREVIKNANKIRNKNMMRKLQENGGSMSGIRYFEDKIDRFLKRSVSSPKMTEMLNKTRLEAFLKGEKVEEEPIIAKKLNSYKGDI